MPNVGTTILLAEDDLTLCEMYSERLKQEGFSVILAKDGEETLNQIREFSPAAVILDLMMPKINGIDVLKELKADPLTKDIPIIVVTALVQEIDTIKDLLGPRDAYLIKSEVMPGDIINHIKKIIEG